MSVACRGLEYGCKEPAVFGLVFRCPHNHLEVKTYRVCWTHSHINWSCGIECWNWNDEKDQYDEAPDHLKPKCVPLDSIEEYPLDYLGAIDVVAFK
jgi:hypothetical protein